MKLGQIEMLSIFGGFFLWLALRALSAAIAITLDITRNLKVEITGTLERKVEAKYIGGERDYQLWINDESFTVQKSKWDQMEVGARYRILFLKNSRLVLEIHHSNDY